MTEQAGHFWLAPIQHPSPFVCFDSIRPTVIRLTQTLRAFHQADMTSLIHLIRHGLPTCDPHPGLSRPEYKSWVEAYTVAGIKDRPPASLMSWLNASGIENMISSTFPRAAESAEALVGHEHLCCDPLFNEAAIAIVPIPFRMHSSAWTAVGRISWLMGASADEDVTAFRLRTQAAADKLMQSASATETALVGHGWMNRAIGQLLLRHGFQIQHRGDNRHWSRTSFKR